MGIATGKGLNGVHRLTQLGRTWSEVDVALGPNDVVRPDLAGFRRERLPRPGNIRPIEVVPDWVCEVLSPSSAARAWS